MEDIRSRDPIGMIGLGLLGSAMATQFMKAGFSIVGFDIDAQRRGELETAGGRAAASSHEVAAACQRIVLSLPNSSTVASLLEDLGSMLRPGTTIADTTTGSPDEMAGFGAKLDRAGVAYLDAAVGGSSRQVRGGEAIVMAGGTAQAFRDCEELFASFAQCMFHVGDWGAGACMKLVLNLALGLNRAVLAEALSFARAVGITPRRALEVLEAGPAYSRVMEIKGEKMLTGEFSPEARLSQHLKDVNLILDLANKSGDRRHCHAFTANCSNGPKPPDLAIRITARSLRHSSSDRHRSSFLLSRFQPAPDRHVAQFWVIPFIGKQDLAPYPTTKRTT